MGRARSGSPQLPDLVEVVASGEIPTDVLLIAAGGVKVGAHGLICASISPVLKAALVGRFRESTSKEINLDHASAATIKKMLSFAIGSLKPDDISGDDAMDLVLLADRLNYEALHSVCENILLSLLTSNNAADLFACASESNCTFLVQTAKAVIDSGSVSNSARVLVDEKCKLNAQRKKLAKESDDARDALIDIEMKITDLETQINHEVEEVFQQTARSLSRGTAVGQSPEADHPSYPHPPGRTLIALPHDPLMRTKESRDAERKKYASFEPLVFDKLNKAMAAALPGDVVKLPKGNHSLDVSQDDSGLKKSIQIIGMEEGVIITSSSLGRGEAFIIEKSNICIRNVTIIQESGKAVAVVRQGGSLWLEDCIIGSDQMRQTSRERPCSLAGIVVTHGASAYVKNCEINATSASAVLVHPMARVLSISDCMFRGSGCGSQVGNHDDDHVVPGEAGSVEICDFPFEGEDAFMLEEGGYANGMPASVKLTLVRTNIVSCFGPAFSYRTRQSKYTRDNFSWPGKSSVIMKGNIFQNNGLLREGGPMPDGEAIIFNDHPEFFDRDPGVLLSTGFLDNYRSTRFVQRF